jgi:hypothetical protein
MFASRFKRVAILPGTISPISEIEAECLRLKKYPPPRTPDHLAESLCEAKNASCRATVRVKSLEDRIRGIARASIDRMAERGSTCDFVRDAVRTSGIVKGIFWPLVAGAMCLERKLSIALFCSSLYPASFDTAGRCDYERYIAERPRNHSSDHTA